MHRNLRLFISCLFMCLYAQLGYAQIIDYVPGESRTPTPTSQGAYVSPSESNPEDAHGILKDAPPGIYLSVGAERANFGYLLTPQATHLLVVDFDLEVIRFHAINSRLIAASPTRQDYLKLRLDATSNDWVRIGLSHSEWRWWRDAVRNGFAGDGKKLHLGGEYARTTFYSVNYLHHDSLFLRLRETIVAGRFQVIRQDLANIAEISQIATLISKKDLNFSVLDFSNAWTSGYAGMQLPASVYAMSAACAPETRILLTQSDDKKQSTRMREAPSSGSSGLRKWIFFGATFAAFQSMLPRIKSSNDWVALLSEQAAQSMSEDTKFFRGKATPIDLHGTLNGKIYPFISPRDPKAPDCSSLLE